MRLNQLATLIRCLVCFEVCPYNLASYVRRALARFSSLSHTDTHVLTSSNEEGVLRSVMPVLCCSRAAYCCSLITAPSSMYTYAMAPF